jgi:Uma2 family endonuclease
MPPQPNAREKLLTAEEYARLGSTRFSELVRGGVVQVSPANARHGVIAARIARILGDFVDRHGLGVILVEGGFIVGRGPDTVRGPDVAFVSGEHIPPEGLPETFVPGAPDLAIEVVSPNDTFREVERKIAEYLEAGGREVWIVEPAHRRVTVYSGPAPGSARIFDAEHTLGTTLLPGFESRVSAFFP